MPDLRQRLDHAFAPAYVLEQELGGGGMSRIFLATETALGRRVVIKVLPPEFAAELRSERFRREILLAASLQHPCIVPVLSAGETERLPYFTMPYVEGETLRARLVREGLLPITDVVHIVRDVASALAHAHAHGVMHRDIKPENVLLSGGYALVTDFGVAKALTAAAAAARAAPGAGGGLTGPGIALGTPAYMSPEQAAADPGVDHRADIYALGVVAYELLTGRPPFAGRASAAIIAAHAVEQAEPVSLRRSDTPAALAAIVMHCLAKAPDARPQRAADIVRALDALPTPGGGTAAVSAPMADAGAPPVAGRMAPRYVAIAVAALAVAAVLLAVLMRG